MARPAVETPARAAARRRIGRAAAAWLGLALAAITVIGVLVVWHLSRRARLIREGLGPPRDVRLPDLDRPDRDPEAEPPTRGP